MQTYLRNSELALRRMCSIAKLLLHFAGESEEEKKAVSVRKILHNALTIFDAAAVRSGITLICDINAASGIAVYANEFRLTRTLLQLLENAREAFSCQPGQIYVDVALHNNSIRISIRDNGPGMDEAHAESVCQPFYTTKTDVGVGLGLTMAARTIHDLQGTIEIKSVLGEGTTVGIVLPVFHDSPSADTIVDQDFQHGRRVLLAVDDADTQHMLDAVLVAREFYVEHVESDEALAARLETPSKFDLIIVDLLRSTFYGDEMVNRIRLQTDAPLVYLTSSENDAPAPHASMEVLYKPFGPDELVQTLRHFPQLVRYRMGS